MKRLLLAWPLIASCAAATQAQLLTRAAFDLNCPESQLQIVELDARTRGVIGCDQRVTYVEDCRSQTTTMVNGPMVQSSTGKTDCTWVMNSARRP